MITFFFHGIQYTHMKSAKSPSPTTSFPFKGVKKTGLVPVENYYMQLIAPRGQVSKLKGTFVKYHTEDDTVKRTYAVFNNVVIMNKHYKKGTCRRMLIRFPDGLLANTDCDSYNNRNREVYLDVNYWKFGLPTEKTLLSKRILKKFPTDMEFEIDTFTGTKKAFKGGNKNICYTGTGSLKSGNHTKKQYLDVMDKLYREKCAVHTKSLQCKSCLKSSKMNSEEAKKQIAAQKNNKTYKMSTKTENQLLQQMSKCKQCKTENTKPCNFNDYLRFSGAELGKC
uniref:Uncharacterized protein n=1 Tax=viral metagenome TaxID=1070528 RepID=A0A6C0HJB2_9ZZZZ